MKTEVPMSGLIPRNEKGFSLIELLLALAILGVVTYFVVTLTNSIRHGNKASTTEQRMEIIAAKMKEYYRHQGELVNAASGNEVPVDELNLEQKYRYDGWGQPIYYHNASRINDATVDGAPNMAGYLLSLGGDQTLDATSNQAGTSPLTLSTLEDTAYLQGDDLLLPINVNREATEIALDELRMLQEKVKAFDRAFAGVDNNGSGTIDGSGCVPADDYPAGMCPPTRTNAVDPNCGTATLDNVEDQGASAYSTRGCSYTNATDLMVKYYSLADDYYNDPWDNSYQWGCNSTFTNCNYNCSADNPRYRKFFSMGANSTDDADDITP
jgi:prepilin-type N-terminal cleavage/methylation domain-containing protein